MLLAAAAFSTTVSICACVSPSVRRVGILSSLHSFAKALIASSAVALSLPVSKAATRAYFCSD